MLFQTATGSRGVANLNIQAALAIERTLLQEAGGLQTVEVSLTVNHFSTFLLSLTPSLRLLYAFMALSQEYCELEDAAANAAAPTRPTRRGGRYARKPRNNPMNKTTNSGTTAKPPQEHKRADPKLAQACLQMAGSKKTNQKQAYAMRRFSD